MHVLLYLYFPCQFVLFVNILVYFSFFLCMGSYFSRDFYIAVLILNLTPALVLHNIPFYMQISLFILTFVIFSFVSVKTCFLL